METKSLFFKPLNLSYQGELFALHSDKEVMKYVREPDKNLAQTMKTIHDQMNFAAENNGHGIWCAHIKTDNAFIGWGYINHLEKNKEQPIEIGYRLKKDYWGRGFASEICGALTDFCFNKLNYQYLCAVTHLENIASQKVLLKNQYNYIGVATYYDHPVKYFERKSK